MRIVLSSLALAAGLALQATAAFAQNNPLSGGFDAFSPGLLGNGGGTYSDFASVREEMVKKIRDGSYQRILQAGRDNVAAYDRLRAQQGLNP